MKSIGIFYGSTTGTTEQVAMEIAEALGVAEADVHDVTKSAPSEVGAYEVLLFGASTWGDGDLQDDMQDFLNGVGQMYGQLVKTGATMIGQYNADGYDFSKSEAVSDGHAVGLVIDNVNHENLTPKKISEWTAEIKRQIA